MSAAFVLVFVTCLSGDVCVSKPVLGFEDLGSCTSVMLAANEELSRFPGRTVSGTLMCDRPDADDHYE